MSLMLPKPRRVQSADYLKFVRLHSCLVKQCWRKPSAHHVRFDGQGGLGTKVPDYQTVPLCVLHHKEEHDLGRDRFEEKYGIIFYMTIMELMTEFIEERLAS
jgi:hypothetical protein